MQGPANIAIALSKWDTQPNPESLDKKPAVALVLNIGAKFGERSLAKAIKGPTPGHNTHRIISVLPARERG